MRLPLWLLEVRDACGPFFTGSMRNLSKLFAGLACASLLLAPALSHADGTPYSSWKNSTGACSNNSTFNDLGDTLPHQEQIGQFATYSGTGYHYVAYSTTGGSFNFPALPAGATIVLLRHRQ